MSNQFSRAWTQFRVIVKVWWPTTVTAKPKTSRQQQNTSRQIIQNLRPIKNSTEKSTEIWLHLMFYTCDYKFLIFPYFSSAGNCGSWKETETFVRKLKPEANALASSKMLLTALVNELVLPTDNERFKFLEPLWISCSPAPGCIKPS